MSVKPMKLSEALADLAQDFSLADVIATKLQAKIAIAITKKRLEYGMTQKEFAKKLNVSQGMVSKWESEDYNFTIESLAQIAEKLELNLEISLTPESDQYRKIQRRESKCEWNGNIWKNKYKENIVELNRAV